jgi:hypothetical protein
LGGPDRESTKEKAELLEAGPPTEFNLEGPNLALISLAPSPVVNLPRVQPVHLKVFGPGTRTARPRTMTDEQERPGLREHLRELRQAFGGIGRDVKIDAVNAPHLAKEGAKNALARAAGVRRTSMREWTQPESEERK